MERMAGWNKGPFASALGQLPALVCLEAVMELAEAVQEVDDGHVNAGPILAVVRL